MKTKPECIQCMFSDLLGAIQAEKLNEKLSFKIIKNCLNFLSNNFESNKIPSYYITHIHRIFKKISKIKIPFKKTRERSNALGEKIANEILKNAENLSNFERFAYLMRWSVVANSIDFRTAGISYDFSFEHLGKELENIFQKGLQVNDTRKIYTLVKKAKNILFVPDNVGEIAIDKIFIKELHNYCENITIALRGGPITSDATIEDGKQINIKEVVKKVILTGPDTLGILFDEIYPEFKKALKEADVIFTKGQANYYAFSEHKSKIKKPVICLFTTKCDTVSSIFGKKGKINIAKII